MISRIAILSSEKFSSEPWLCQYGCFKLIESHKKTILLIIIILFCCFCCFIESASRWNFQYHCYVDKVLKTKYVGKIKR